MNIHSREFRALRRLLYLFGLKRTWDFPVRSRPPKRPPTG